MKEQLIIDANYCLLCKRPSCIEGCPARVNIPGMMKHVQESNFEAAYEENRKRNILPYLCGKLCPHEKQCEGHCIRAKKGKSVNIGFVEHGVARLFNNKIQYVDKQLKEVNVAIVGAGITGISAAFELASHGAKVTLFEKTDKIGGAVALYLPHFRFDDAILNNLHQNLLDLNVKIKFNHELGIHFNFNDLLIYDYQIIALGAEIPLNGNLPINLPGVYYGLNILKEAKKTNKIPFKNQDVLVIGAGNVAMDVSRLIKSYGNDVTIVYRRTLSESLASRKEIDDAKNEGVLFKELLSPIDIKQSMDSLILKCQKMELVQESTKERLGIKPIEGNFEEIKTQGIVLAIGSSANHHWIKQNPTSLKALLDENNNLQADYQNYYNRLYLAGDYVTGPKTIVKAMTFGRDLAEDIIAREAKATVKPKVRVMFGGSFNPPTIGHVEMIKCLQKELDAEVLIVPNGDDYSRKELVSFAHRLQMLHLATKGINNVKIIDIENKNPFQGTVWTLRKLDHPICALGADSVSDLPSWIDYHNLLKENQFVIFNRSNIDLKALLKADETLKQYQNHFHILPCSITPTSSSAFRQTHDSEIVSPEVYEYIIKHQLYQK